jgi:hypothetical protein
MVVYAAATAVSSGEANNLDSSRLPRGNRKSQASQFANDFGVQRVGDLVDGAVILERAAGAVLPVRQEVMNRLDDLHRTVPAAVSPIRTDKPVDWRARPRRRVIWPGSSDNAGRAGSLPAQVDRFRAPDFERPSVKA